MKKISKTMLTALRRMSSAQGLDRLPGGYWVPKGQKTVGGPREYDGTTTVHALVHRGLAQYTEQRNSNRAGGSFPVAARLTDAGKKVIAVCADVP